ncbi:hypothetical protein TRVL_04351 [Trypanosoma vivax]|nr:hypothetical protein TRVL_04351 [Trypanosoma vivax]
MRVSPLSHHNALRCALNISFLLFWSTTVLGPTRCHTLLLRAFFARCVLTVGWHLSAHNQTKRIVCLSWLTTLLREHALLDPHLAVSPHPHLLNAFPPANPASQFVSVSRCAMHASVVQCTAAQCVCFAGSVPLRHTLLADVSRVYRRPRRAAETPPWRVNAGGTDTPRRRLGGAARTTWPSTFGIFLSHSLAKLRVIVQARHVSRLALRASQPQPTRLTTCSTWSFPSLCSMPVILSDATIVLLWCASRLVRVYFHSLTCLCCSSPAVAWRTVAFVFFTRRSPPPSSFLILHPFCVHWCRLQRFHQSQKPTTRVLLCQLPPLAKKTRLLLPCSQCASSCQVPCSVLYASLTPLFMRRQRLSFTFVSSLSATLVPAVTHQLPARSPYMVGNSLGAFSSALWLKISSCASRVMKSQLCPSTEVRPKRVTTRCATSTLRTLLLTPVIGEHKCRFIVRCRPARAAKLHALHMP